MDIAERKSEVETKLVQLRTLLAARQLDGILINQFPNTSWITAGASVYVNEASESSTASILVTPDKAYVLTDGIEAPRLREDERLADLGFEIIAEPWYARGSQTRQLFDGKRIGQDGAGAANDVNAELRDLRTVFSPSEQIRLREVGKLAAEAMDESIRKVQPGDTEYKLASYLAAASRIRGGTAIVNLIASDERISQFRHPLPTAKKVDRYAMLVLCLRKYGLVISITRLVYFGTMREELRDKVMTAARVDAKVIAGSQPGRTMGDMFNLLKQAYQDEGHPEAIDQHHQGGTAGYASREVLATPGDKTPIRVNQVFAWNPSVTGAKSEDTVLLTDKGMEVLTVIPGWPLYSINVDGRVIERPAILEK